MKFWIGNLGKCAQMGVMFAQLHLKGNNYGVHAFLTPMRDTINHKPLPGITIGDCGDKIGLNGIDNGWCRFNDFRVPKDGLLDRISQVTDDGEYTSMYENEGKRFAMSIASLSSGRVILSRLTQENTFYALTIAMRHGLMRR